MSPFGTSKTFVEAAINVAKIVVVAATATAMTGPEAIAFSPTPTPVVVIADSTNVTRATASRVIAAGISVAEIAVVRLEKLRSLTDDHNGEGGLAPRLGVIDSAIEFVLSLRSDAPSPVVGVDGDGYAVVDLREDGGLTQVLFTGERNVEVYVSQPDTDPLFVEGSLDDVAVMTTFKNVLGYG